MNFAISKGAEIVVKVKFYLSEYWVIEQTYEEESINEVIDVINASLNEGWITDNVRWINLDQVKYIEFVESE